MAGAATQRPALKFSYRASPGEALLAIAVLPPQVVWIGALGQQR